MIRAIAWIACCGRAHNNQRKELSVDCFQDAGLVPRVSKNNSAVLAPNFRKEWLDHASNLLPIAQEDDFEFLASSTAQLASANFSATESSIRNR